MFTLEDDENKQQFTLMDGQSIYPVLPQPRIEENSQKLNYALGDTSPGVDNLRLKYTSGEESTLRQSLAQYEDAHLYKTKLDMIQSIAASGKKLTPDEQGIIMGMTKAEFRTDPATIIEKKFAEKYINDSLVNNAAVMGTDWSSSPEWSKDVEVATNVTAGIEYFRNQSHILEKEAEDRNTFAKIGDFGTQLLPFVPWWQQKRALEGRKGVEGLMGTTMRENIQYLWALPDEQRRTQYHAAIDKLKEVGAYEDAMTFARAMVSFPTSDEYLANVITLADYTTLGSFILKPFTRATGRAAARAGEEILQGTTPNPASPWIQAAKKDAEAANLEQVKYRNPDPQGEMFLSSEMSGNPRLGNGQNEFRFMNDPEQVRPTAPLPRNRKGQVMGAANRNALIEGSYVDEATGEVVQGTYGIPKRGPAPEVNPDTGIYRGQGGRFGKATTHGEQYGLDLQQAEHQMAMDLFAAPATKDVRQTLGDAVKALEGDKLVPEQVLSATGKVQASVLVDAPKRTIIGSNLDTLSDLKNEIPTFAAPYSFTQEGRVLSREAAQRLTRTAQEWNTTLWATFNNAVRNTRVTPEALSVGLKESEAYLRKTYNRFSDSIINIRHTPADMSPENVDKLSLQIGTTEAKLFPSREQAILHRDEVYKIPEARVQRQGDGFYLEVDRHIDETTDSVRDALWTAKNKLETNVFKMFASRLLSSDSILPVFQSEQRKIATHAPQELRAQVVKMMDEYVTAMSKQEKKELNQILKINTDVERRGRPDKRGDWFETAGELEQSFFQKFNKAPSEAQIAAYDAFRRAHDFEYMLANAAVYRDKARQGIKQFQAKIGDQTTPFFEGKPHDGMPWSLGKGDQDAGVYIHNSETGQGVFRYKFDMTPAERKELDRMVNEKGYRVVQVFDPSKHPLKGLGKTKTGDDLVEQVNFIVSDSYKEKNLDWRQVEYEPGPHVIYKKNWYIATPDVREGRGGKLTYFGDKILLNVSTEAEAAKWSAKMEEAKDLIRFGKDAEANAFIAKNLPYTRAEFDKLIADGMIDMNNRVAFKEAGRRTIDTVPELRGSYNSGNLIDSTRNVHDLSSVMDKGFLAERDKQLFSVYDGPKPTLVPAEELDPFVAFNRAFGQRMKNIWINDYKISAVETWIQNGVKTGVMKPNEKTLMAHPTYFLYNPQWNESADKSLLAAAKAEQRAIVNFIGARNELGDAVSYVSNKIQNSIYNTLGQGRVLDATLEATADPTTFMRGIAFHTKLGFFNPVQFFVQAQSLSHIAAVAPGNAIQGMAAATFARHLAHNPDMLEHYSKVSEKFGWKAADFKEFYDKLRASGLYQVGGEAVLRDDAFDPKLFKSTIGHFLDSGAFFFNEGERLVRLSAFAVAYREWKAANGMARLGDREMAQIMNRSDLLSLNMTRASSAAWQNGAMSIPTQFWAYNARMMEQFLGGRLSGMERARAFAAYSAMYGVPIAAGAVAGVWPVYDSFREEAIKRGINMDANAFTKIFQDGVFQYLQSLTGKESNIAARYGPGNNTQIKDILDGDKTVAEAVFGASGTILGSMYKATQPFYYWAASVFGGEEFPMKASDWLSVAREISTLDVASKAIGAAAYHKWYTKSGSQVSEADGWDAFLAVLGLTPKQATDAFLTRSAVKDQRDGQDKYENMALENYRRGLQSMAAGDVSGANGYMDRARTIMKAGDFTFAQQNRVYQRALEQNKDLADTVRWELFKNAPASRQQQMLDALQRKN